ncbi:MAG: endo-1,4-beta-xylanase [Nonlabens sp.]|uniref:endo-1,4-beta-xylanase n=1 Tax=Nonlabens sp. TaxID=1888209 RepID=UPI003EF69A86
MKKYLYLLIAICSIAACAQQPERRDLLQSDRLASLYSRDKAGEINFEEETLYLKTIEQPKFIYKLTTTLPIKKERVSKNAVVLLSFEGKTNESSEETGEAKLLIQLRQSDSFKENLDRTLNIGSVWKKYYIPFQATQNISKDDLAVVFQFGFQPQELALKNIKFEVFPQNTALEDLPKTEVTYIGMEMDAEWRKIAQARIEKLRKSDFNITVSKNGQPVEKANVQVELVRHSFPFGATMHAEELLKDKDQYERFKKVFGLTVLGNDLKIKRWSSKSRRKQTMKAIDMLRADNIAVKGHVLMWPGFQYNSDEVKANKNNPEKVKELVRKHMWNVLAATNGKISHWDVVNEAYTNKDFQNLMGGEEFLYEAFKITKNKAPQVTRFVNEYGIISKGGIDTQKQQWYYDYIKRVDEHVPGAVQGIGIQSHMGTDLTPPERVIEILSFYATLGKPISISEFTMDEQDPVVREQYTRDFMIAAFSHPNVAEFMFWGFQEDGRGKVDIYEKDGTIGEMGKAYFSLVDKDWKTTLSRKLTKKESIESRGFHGLYQYAVTVDGETKTGYFEVKNQKMNEIKIEL